MADGGAVRRAAARRGRPAQRRGPLPLLDDGGDRRRPRHAPARLPRRDRELAARLQHRHDRPLGQRLPRRRGAHRRQPALEPARRDGDRPLPARASTTTTCRRWRRTCASGRAGRCRSGHRQPARLAAPGDDGGAAPGVLPVRPGGAGAVRRRPGRPATRRSRSRSSARPARSTPRPPPRSRCTPGSARTPTCPARTPGAAERSGPRSSTVLEGGQPARGVALDGALADPSSAAVSATDSPSQCRSTTVLRCIGGSAWSASNSAARSSTGSGSRAARSAASARPLAAPRPPGLVDVGAHDDRADVGLLAAVAPHPRPGDVQLDQRGLHEVVGAVPVAADRVGDPAQVGAPGARRTPRTPRRARALHSRPPPPSAYRSRAKSRNASRSGPPSGGRHRDVLRLLGRPARART